MNKTISATIVADSKNQFGDRITSFILTYPRFIHAELMTHRVFSRNSASSRAIPFDKMVDSVLTDPFIPIAWQLDHKGMQGTEYKDDSAGYTKKAWLSARDAAVEHAQTLNKSLGITKQLANRLLEPFMWHTVLVTSTSYENWFELRCPKYRTPVSQTIEHQRSRKNLIMNHSNPINLDLMDALTEEGWWLLSESGAEIHIQALAEAMWDKYNENEPAFLAEGDWHLPFGDKLDRKATEKLAWIEMKDRNTSPLELDIAVCTARCARLSYMTFDNEIDYKKDIALHDMLLENKHMSPFEHCAKNMTSKQRGESEWSGNFKGFIQYRKWI